MGECKGECKGELQFALTPTPLRPYGIHKNLKHMLISDINHWFSS